MLRSGSTIIKFPFFTKSNLDLSEKWFGFYSDCNASHWKFLWRRWLLAKNKNQVLKCVNAPWFLLISLLQCRFQRVMIIFSTSILSSPLIIPIWKYWLVQITAPGMYCVEDFAEEETNSCVFNLSVWDPDLNLNEMKFTGHDEMRVYLWGLLSLCFILSTMLDVPYAWLGLWGVFLVHLQGGSDWQLTSLRGGFPVDSVGPLQLP